MSKIICRQVLNDEERKACFKIRKQVFVDEQRLFYDSDHDAHDNVAIHIVAIINGNVVGTVRVYREENDIWVGGRLAVKKRYRGKIGKLLVLKAVEIVKKNNAKLFKAIIQSNNIPFFINLNWEPKVCPKMCLFTQSLKILPTYYGLEPIWDYFQSIGSILRLLRMMKLFWGTTGLFLVQQM